MRFFLTRRKKLKKLGFLGEIFQTQSLDVADLTQPKQQENDLNRPGLLLTKSYHVVRMWILYWWGDLIAKCLSNVNATISNTDAHIETWTKAFDIRPISTRGPRKKYYFMQLRNIHYPLSLGKYRFAYCCFDYCHFAYDDLPTMTFRPLPFRLLLFCLLG